MKRLTFTSPTTTEELELPFTVAFDGAARFAFSTRDQCQHAIDVAVAGGKVREIRITGPDDVEVLTVERRVRERREALTAEVAA